MKCTTCGGETIQKSQVRLFTVGVLMIASIGIPFYFPWFWAPSIILLLIGAYLVLWATRGHGSWCRTCKRFSLS